MSRMDHLLKRPARTCRGETVFLFSFNPQLHFISHFNLNKRVVLLLLPSLQPATSSDVSPSPSTEARGLLSLPWEMVTHIASHLPAHCVIAVLPKVSFKDLLARHFHNIPLSVSAVFPIFRSAKHWVMWVRTTLHGSSGHTD